MNAPNVIPNIFSPGRTFFSFRALFFVLELLAVVFAALVAPGEAVLLN